MPIVTVEWVAEADRPRDEAIAQALADAVGLALRSPPGQTWIRLRSLARSDYAENQRRIAIDELPVFVTVLERRPPRDAELRAEIGALVQAIAHVLRRSAENVHIEYAPDATGRVAFGGKLVE